MITTALAATLVAAYLTYMSIKAKEIPDSISETAYIADNQWVFTIGILSFIVLTWASLVQKCSPDTEYLAFLTAAGLTSVALSPDYKTKHKIMHYGGGILALIASQLLIYLNGAANLLYTWLLYPLTLLFSRENWVFWAEIICVITIFLFIS